MENYIYFVFEKNNEEHMFQLYTAVYPHMQKHIPFDEFYIKKEKKTETTKPKKEKTQEEILKDVSLIMHSMKAR